MATSQMEQAAAAGVGTGSVLVALDIDGTLVDQDGKVPAETVGVLDLARAAGHQVVLATGRSLVGLLPIATRLGLSEGWAVCSNGALTVRVTSSASARYVLDHAKTFDPGPVIRRALELVPRVRVGVEDVGSGWHVNRLFDAGQLNGQQKVVPLQDLWAAPATRVVIQAPGIQRFMDGLRATGATVTPAGTDWLDITVRHEALADRVGVRDLHRDP